MNKVNEKPKQFYQIPLLSNRSCLASSWHTPLRSSTPLPSLSFIFLFFSFLQNLSILLKEKIILDRPSSSPYFMRLPLISLMFLSTPFQKNFSILSRNLSTSHSRWPLSTSPPNSLIFPKIPSQSSSPTISFYFPTKNSFLFLPK